MIKRVSKRVVRDDSIPEDLSSLGKRREEKMGERDRCLVCVSLRREEWHSDDKYTGKEMWKIKQKISD